MINTDEFVTISQAAAMSGVTTAAIYDAIKGGKLSAVEVLGRKAVRRADVQAWEPRSYAGRPGSKPKGGRPKKQ